MQHHDDYESWYQYETQNFVVHWYGKSRTNAQFVIHIAEVDFEGLDLILEHHINDKIEIFVYADISDIKQSNVGIEEAFVNTDNQTKVIGRRMYVYFDGDYNNLRDQIRSGIIDIYLYDMMYGFNLQQLVQNTITQDLPEWYLTGVRDYINYGWRFEDQAAMLRQWQYTNHQNLDDLFKSDPSRTGQFFWHYISANYGLTTISDILYVTRLNRNLSENFNYVIGQNEEQLRADIYQFAQSVFSSPLAAVDTSITTELRTKKRKYAQYHNIAIHPHDQDLLAFTTNERGLMNVELFNVQTGEQKRLLRTGSRNHIQATDYAYPIMAWSPDGQFLTIIYEKRDIIYQRIIDWQSKEYDDRPLSPDLERVFSITYSDAEHVVLSAMKKGQIDLYLYHLDRRQHIQITDDIYVDSDVAYGLLDNRSGILFKSNRPQIYVDGFKSDTILPIDHYDVYFVPISGQSIAPLEQLTYTPSISEYGPKWIGRDSISYHVLIGGKVYDRLGLLHRVHDNHTVITFNNGTIAHFSTQDQIPDYDSSTITRVTTQSLPVWSMTSTDRFRTQLLRHDIAPRLLTSETIESVQSAENDVIVLRNTKAPITHRTPEVAWYKDDVNWSGDQIEPSTHIEKDIDPSRLFQTPFPEAELNHLNFGLEEHASHVGRIRSRPSGVEPLNYSRILASRRRFALVDSEFKLDNELLFDGLRSFAGQPDETSFSAFGLKMSLTISDLLSDYQLEAGARFPTDLTGSEYYLVLDQDKRLIDKRYAFYRRANTEFIELTPNNEEIKDKTITYILLSRWKYPLDVYRSIRAAATFRIDELFRLSSEPISLNQEKVRNQRLGLKLAYVFDNTIQVDKNILHGSRYSIHGEVVKRLAIDIVDNWSFSLGEGVMTILGLDARHYQRLDEKSVLALRLAGSTSFGSEKILYRLGGVDNWLFPSEASSIRNLDDNFAYQQLAVHMRGSKQNIRFGNSFLVSNIELRIPIIQYFTSRRIRSAMLRNFILVAFTDAGTAWQGSTPFGDDSPLNMVTVSNSRSQIRANYYRDPIILGYGLGLRLPILGYDLRFDYGWGIESGETSDPVFYFSIGKDF